MRKLLLLPLAIILTLCVAGQTATELYDAGIKAQEAKTFDIAVTNFKKATAAKSDYGEAWFQLGWCYNELEQYADAIVALNKAKTYWPDQPKVFFELGYANDFMNKTDEAVTNYRQCLALDDAYAGAYRQLGNIDYDVNSDYAAALKNFTRYIELKGDEGISSTVYYRKGYCEIEADQYNDAVTTLKKSIALDDKYAPAYDELGYAYYKLAMSDEALAAYKTSMSLLATSSTPYTGSGDVARYLLKNTDDAVKNYTKALELNPKSQNSNYGLGWCYNDKEQYNTAIPYLKKALEINSQYGLARIELGYSYYALDRYDEALQEFSKGQAISESALGYYYSGLCYIAKKQKTNAQGMYEKLKTMQSDNASVLLDKINAMN